MSHGYAGPQLDATTAARRKTAAVCEILGRAKSLSMNNVYTLARAAGARAKVRDLFRNRPLASSVPGSCQGEHGSQSGK